MRYEAASLEAFKRTHVAWAAAESWNPGTEDAEALYSQDPESILLAYETDKVSSEKPVACITIPRFGDEIAFLGFYIVRPESERGKGYGLGLFRYALSRAQERNVGLDGVPAQEHNYAKSGFTVAWRNARLSLSLSRIPALLAEMSFTGDQELVALTPGTSDSVVAAVAQFDDECVRIPRGAFIKRFLKVAHSAFAILHHSSSDSSAKIAGWGMVRQSVSGYRIGPVLAEDTETASRILQALLASLPTDSSERIVCIDACTANPLVAAVFPTSHWATGFETARMWTKGLPKGTQVKKIYGVFTLEMG